jgi:hypothetical protein
MYYNKRDLVAALNALFTIDMIANDPEDGNPDGKIAKEINRYISQLSQSDYPRKLVEFKDLADNASDTYAYSYMTGYKEMKELLPALMSTYGYQVDGVQQGDGASNNQELTQEQIQKLIQEQE